MFHHWPLGSKKKFNIDFREGGHLGYPIRTILATFNLQITSILPMNFRVTCPFGSEETFSKRIFQMAAKTTILRFPIKMSFANFDLK